MRECFPGSNASDVCYLAHRRLRSPSDDARQFSRFEPYRFQESSLAHCNSLVRNGTQEGSLLADRWVWMSLSRKKVIAPLDAKTQHNAVRKADPTLFCFGFGSPSFDVVSPVKAGLRTL